jgi:ssDNA-binding Zn-finger/Zn-ribbon topoisomerase 1
MNSMVFSETAIRESTMKRGNREPIEVVCPKCRYTEIIYLPIEDLPRCPQCDVRMSISELLDEGKSY